MMKLLNMNKLNSIPFKYGSGVIIKYNQLRAKYDLILYG